MYKIASFSVGVVMAVCLVACGGGSGSSGATTTTNTTSSTSGTTVTDGKATLTIPAASFASDVAITLVSGTADTSSIGNVTALAQPVSLTFSEVTPVVSTDPMQLVIKLSAAEMTSALAAGKGIYAKVRMDGGQLGSDGSNTGQGVWVPILGSVDQNNATITFDLYGGGDSISIVPVAGNELQVVATIPDGVSVTTSESKSTRSKAVNTVTMGTRPWAIICNNPSFADGGTHTCDPNDPNSTAMIMLSRLYADSNSFAQLGFDQLIVYQLRGREIIHSGVPQVPTADVMNAHNPETIYNVAYLSDATPCPAGASCYLPGLGQLHVLSSHIGVADITQMSDDVIMHELTHAVQHALCPHCFTADASNAPMTEGTATVMGLWPVVQGNAAQLAGKYIYNRERSWQEPIAELTQTSLYDVSYQMTQFFSLVDDGTVTKLPTLFRKFEAAIAKPSFLRRLDTALSDTYGHGLVYNYIRTMALRNYDTKNRDNYILNIPDWTDISSTVYTFTANHYYRQADWAPDPNGCYNVARITSSPNPDLVLAVVATQVGRNNAQPGSSKTIDLGNGNSVVYTVDGADLETSNPNHDNPDSCIKDVIVMNINLDGDITEHLDYKLLIGFD